MQPISKQLLVNTFIMTVFYHSISCQMQRQMEKMENLSANERQLKCLIIRMLFLHVGLSVRVAQLKIIVLALDINHVRTRVLISLIGTCVGKHRHLLN